MARSTVVMVVDLRELALIFELTEDASEDSSLHFSDQETARELHEDCRELLG